MKIDKNFIAIVTGGSSGLGQATVRLLRSMQAQVVIADINDEAGKKISFQTGSEFFLTDVTNQTNCLEAIQFTIKKYGQIHSVINCAGVFIPQSTLSPDTKQVGSSELLLKTLKINTLGALNTSKYAIQEMLKQTQVDGQRGVIINVSSLLAQSGKSYHVLYAASKGALSAITLPLARELLPHKIRVMTIAPGMFDTPMISSTPQELRKIYAGFTLLGFQGKPQWFAMGVKDIIENSFANGAVWKIDGGFQVPNF